MGLPLYSIKSVLRCLDTIPMLPNTKFTWVAFSKEQGPETQFNATGLGSYSHTVHCHGPQSQDLAVLL